MKDVVRMVLDDLKAAASGLEAELSKANMNPKRLDDIARVLMGSNADLLKDVAYRLKELQGGKQ